MNISSLSNSSEISFKGFCSLDFCPGILFDVILQGRGGVGRGARIYRPVRARDKLMVFVSFKFCFRQNFCLMTFREACLDLTPLENRHPNSSFYSPETNLASL